MSNGAMTQCFPLVPLGEVLTQYKHYIDAPEPKMYPKLSVKLYGKGVVLDTPTDGTTLKMQRHQLARSGQVILSEIWGKKGAIGLVPPEGEGALCTSHFFLFDVDHERVNQKYLQFVFTANYLEEQLNAHAKGTTGYAAVRPKHLLAAKIPLPPLDEQRRIVARIEKLAANIEEARGLRRQAVEEIDAFITGLHLHLAKERIVKLSELLVLHECREEVQFGKVYPQVGVKGFGQGLFAREILEASQTTYRTFNRLYDGAIVLSQVKGWEGAIAVCGEDLAGKYVSPEYRTFRCLEGQALPEYLNVLFATSWFWSQLQQLTRGMGGRRERIRPEFFLAMRLPMPGIVQQEHALLAFEKISALRQLQSATAAELDVLLPSVLDKAFKGKL